MAKLIDRVKKNDNASKKFLKQQKQKDKIRSKIKSQKLKAAEAKALATKLEKLYNENDIKAFARINTTEVRKMRELVDFVEHVLVDCELVDDSLFDAI